IVNRAGGAAHARMIADAVGGACRAEPLGALGWDAALAMPERHLGLHTAADGALTAARIARLGDAVERGVDVERLLAMASPLPVLAPAPPPAPGARVRLGVARDAAFQFYYQENLDRLSEAGADLVWWSPLADADVPDVDGLYLGGGYPELHAATLADNAALRKSLRRFAEAGRPVYAECGGLMYLAESLETLDGRVHPMVGLLPAAVRMREHGLTLGYAEVTLAADTPLGPAGAVARGQEFHTSTLGPVPPAIARAYRVHAPGGGERAEGYLIGRALLSYVHLHFASNPGLAPALVAACARAR
ncbi:MAG TPA: cobyrinate a,c-diamide synthase, partial [Methylomirabilota bacterium]|nr:cobyrinate a,c-diamide synthase [Methylomirabilota bacterium]